MQPSDVAKWQHQMTWPKDMPNGSLILPNDMASQAAVPK